MIRFWIIALSFLSIGLFAQEDVLRIGEWRSHFAFNNCSEIIKTPDKTIGMSSHGLILLELSDYSLSTLTKVNGLSDFGLSTITWDKNDQSLLVGYENGNIDIIKNGRTRNINELKMKQMDGLKKINHFLIIDNLVYCATDFGIIVLNLTRAEITSTYFIGDEASNLPVNKLATDNEFLYAATTLGIKRVRLDAPNKQMYQAWEQFSNDLENYIDIISESNVIIAVKGTKGETCTIVHFEGGSANTFATATLFQRLRKVTNGIAAISTNAIRLYDENYQLTQTISGPSIGGTAITAAFRDVTAASDGGYWISDNSSGILRRNATGIWLNYLPQGPVNNMARNIVKSGENIWVVPGGLTTFWNNAAIPATISQLTPSGWKQLTPENSPILAGASDLLSIVPNPKNPDNLFITSWGSGLFEIQKENSEYKVKNHFFITENGLQNIFNDNSRYVRVASAVLDRNNVLWVTNSEKEEAIVAYFPEDGNWQRYNYEGIRSAFGMAPLIEASTGDKWLIIGRASIRGLFIWNDNGTPKDQSDDRYKGVKLPSEETDNRNKGQIFLWDEEGVEMTKNIFSIAEDQNGHIWLGTDQGVIVQYQPGTIFTREKPVFSKIRIARGDGTNNADFLLADETVSAIAIDPGNRKWLGTQGNGVFLVSPDGTRQISVFNTNNSPLPSDYISSITIDEKTGEVFFATGAGIVSYKGTATQGQNNYADMYVFPNPVRPGFTGSITITGLVAQSNVKITDVAGKLVYETNSIGGQAFWDGKNLWGEPVKSGIYLVFVSSEDGSSSGVTKVAVVR
jgi:hypothetical protein